MSRFTAVDIALLLLRAGAAVLLLTAHGLPKLANFAERSATFSDPIGVGSTAALGLVVFAEVVCSTLVALGLLTRLATIPIVIFFAVAFYHHGPDPWAKKEFVLVYALPFVAVLIAGPGAISLDAVLARARVRKAMALER